jgi:RNA polymerase sigma factor (sigma-70 family)
MSPIWRISGVRKRAAYDSEKIKMVAVLVPADYSLRSGGDATLLEGMGTSISLERAAWTSGPVDNHGDFLPIDRSGDIDQTAAWLLRAVAIGHSEAFWSLWGLYREDLFKLCLRTMGGVRGDAEDALSLAMLRARDKLPTYAIGIRNIRGWLGKVTLNLCLDIYRERRLEARCLEDMDQIRDRSVQRGTASSPSPEAQALDAEVRRHLELAIKALPPRLYDPFRLRFFLEMTYASIGNRLGIPPAHAQRRVEQALLFLRARLRRGGALRPVNAESCKTLRHAKDSIVPLYG